MDSEKSNVTLNHSGISGLHQAAAGWSMLTILLLPAALATHAVLSACNVFVQTSPDGKRAAPALQQHAWTIDRSADSSVIHIRNTSFDAARSRRPGAPRAEGSADILAFDRTPKRRLAQR